MGRLADAKNQARLIDAFDLLCKKQKEKICGFISSATVRCANKLRKQITKLKLTGKVILTGNISNPFALLADCDCFVLPSFTKVSPWYCWRRARRICLLSYLIFPA